MIRKQPALESRSTRIVAVLSVSPIPEDRAEMLSILSHSKWEMHHVDRFASAMQVLRKEEIGVVLCERDLRPGSWIDVLDGLRTVPDAPPLIVTSRVADEKLWAEALNLGAYDVLAKPFDRQELVRSVSLAWLHWLHREPRAVRAAS